MQITRMFQTVRPVLKTHFRIVVIVLILLALIGGYVGYRCYWMSREALYIAVAGPMNTPEGDAMVKGIKILLDEVNARGGVHGKRVKLLGFDDEQNPDLARKQAQNIADHEKILLVLGHYESSTALAGGEIYQQTGIPAITASALTNDVTEGNPWYFRVTPGNRAQAAFLANYVRTILQYDTASIIYSRDSYGRSLREDFVRVFLGLGGTVKYVWHYNPQAQQPEHTFQAIVNALESKGQQADPGIIFLATREAESAKLVAAMKRKGLDYPIIGDDWTINTKLAQEPEEQKTPGCFSDGIYAAVPIHFDFAGEKAKRFQEAFKNKYNQSPDIIAAMYYDAALVAVQAIKQADIQGKPGSLADDREQIRETLAGLTDRDQAVQGVSGLIYFDPDGNLTGNRSLTMGIFHDQELTSALTQLTPVEDVSRIANLDEELKANRILFINDRYMYKTSLVHTGIEINTISELDLQDLSYDLDFYLWFRYQGEFDDANIVFLNAVTPLRLAQSLKENEPGGVLIAERIQDGLTYRRYHVKGRFKADFLPGLRGFKQQHILGVSFHHARLRQQNLIYFVDKRGMALSDERSLLKHIQEKQVLSAGSGWILNQARHFEDRTVRSSLGDPRYLDAHEEALTYSRFNTGLWIKRTQYFGRKIISILQDIIPISLTPVFVIVSLIALVILEVIRKRKLYKQRIIRFGQSLFLFTLFLAGEGFFIDWLGRVILPTLGATGYTYYLNITTLVFEILWFLLPAFLLTMVIELFLWAFIEEHLDYVMPHIIRHVVMYVIYILTFFGIVAFVFGQDITRLAATSGVIALLIGLASKVDISNMFAGIGISVTKPFRIGDWVRVNDLDEGKVIDMTSRVTKIETRDRTMLSIPNTMVAGGVLENYNYPDKHYRIKITLQTVPIYRYERVEKILLDAVLSTEGVLKDPPPAIIFHGQGDSAAIFAVHCYVDDYSQRVKYTQDVWRRVWRHLELAGIELATPRREILMVESTPEDVTAPLTILRQVSLFQSLPEDAKVTLSEHVRRHHFAQGTPIFRQGDQENSLFVVVEGAVGLWLQFKDGKAIEAFRVGVTDFFGAMELLSGETRRCNAIPITDTVVFEISGEALTPILQEYPQVAEILEQRMAAREARIEEQTDLYQLEAIEKDAPSKKLLKKTQEILTGKKGGKAE